jgi:hypothetical protein
MYHETITTFAYADGHVAFHKWTDPEAVRSGISQGNGGTMWFAAEPHSADCHFVGQNYQFPGWKMPPF